MNRAAVHSNLDYVRRAFPQEERYSVLLSTVRSFPRRLSIAIDSPRGRRKLSVQCRGGSPCQSRKLWGGRGILLGSERHTQMPYWYISRSCRGKLGALTRDMFDPCCSCTRAFLPVFKGSFHSTSRTGLDSICCTKAHQRLVRAVGCACC